ncbi:MAG: YbgC/FadM family acyl-CoA thioesterase [Nitrospiraceae bacterium]|nr:YbgC/FadM family acyl-CoA thioesterase [Nitrospiraceae bacterium]
MTRDIFRVKVYYEDTDCGGVVYYANYLRYFERARTELLEARGVNMKGLMNEGVFFVVAEASLKYRAPGRYGDILIIETVIDRIGPASITVTHRVINGEGARIVDAVVKLGCVGRDMKPLKIRHDIMKKLTAED